VNVEVKDGAIHYGFYTTRIFPDATARLMVAGKTLLEETVAIDPAKPYVKKFALPAGASVHEVRAVLLDGDRELVAYSPIKLTPAPQPEPWKPPVAPAEFKSDEELTLAAQRIDQFHDPDRDPEPWWEEALRRDPNHTAAHVGLGLMDLRRARYAAAESHFQTAITRLTAKHTTPKNAEPFYYLGVALRGQGRDDEAYDAFFKATWSQEWTAPAYYALAEIATSRGDFRTALDFTNRSLDANALNVRVYGLKAALLRQFGLKKLAVSLVEHALRKTDPLDVRLMAERWLATPDEGGGVSAETELLFTTLNTEVATIQELAAEFANAGLWQDGTAVLAHAIRVPGAAQNSPVVHYYLAHFAEKLRQPGKATEYRRLAAQKSPDYVFPFQAELIPVLRRAIEMNPADARAHYYLGNLLFDWQPAEAIALWEKSVALDPSFAIAWRNLAQAYAHAKPDSPAQQNAKAVAALEKSVALPKPHPTLLAELDSLYAATKTSPTKRLARLESHQASLGTHDESIARLVGLKTLAGKTDEAIAVMTKHTFNIWEGGTRFNTGDSWIDAHLVRGLARLKAKQAGEALTDFETAGRFPANLRANDNNSRLAEISYWLGCAHEALGDSTKASEAWTRAANARTNLARRGGGDIALTGESFRRSNQRYHQALAWGKLGQKEKAEEILRELIAAGSTPASGESDATSSASAARHFAAGLGHAGLGEKEKARTELTATLTEAPDQLAAKIALDQL
jgi:tetratricopeptide (TPR) repeat protein